MLCLKSLLSSRAQKGGSYSRLINCIHLAYISDCWPPCALVLSASLPALQCSRPLLCPPQPRSGSAGASSPPTLPATAPRWFPPGHHESRLGGALPPRSCRFHSLGAALAVLIADEIAGSGGAPAPVAVFSFGGPRVGNRAFAQRVEARGARVLRVVNAHDVVPRFPPPLPGRYADVGRELLLDSRASPYLRPDADAACCHDLEAYIHLVDGFLGSHCPFRANAKRSILRLLKNQGGWRDEAR